MSRRAARTGNSAAVSLFPFLAVLICTMGALIVLLVVVVQQARVEGASVADEEPPAPSAPVVDADAVAARLVQLLALRDQATAQLEQHRLALSELEDHTRALEDEFARLEAEAQRYEERDQNRTDDLDQLQAQHEELARQIEQAEEELEQARRAQGAKPRSYAIIPYEGPQGTRRRPIYIECRSDRVILQPEGVVLLEGDFQPPLGPGNALAATLRAMREYWASRGMLGPSGEPYPLLLVRPDGAYAYASAREAMKSWDAEFGYELLDADMQLAFPPPDPQLAAVLQRSLADARARQEALVRAAPSRFGGSGGSRDGWGDNGGFSTGGTGQNGDLASAGPAGTGTGSGIPSRDGAGGFYDTDYGAGSGTGGPGTGSTAQSGLPGSPQAGAGQSPPGSNGTEGPHGQSGRAGTGGPFAGSNGQQFAEGGTPGTPTGEPTTARGSGQTQSSAQPGSVAGGSGVGGNVSADFGGSGTGGSPGPQGGGQPTQCLADSRGANWGLPRDAGTTIGYSRPIRVALDTQQIVIQREHGDPQRPIVVPLGPAGPAGSIDQFVSALWDYMEDWGQAGPGSYWKPILNVEVAPGAEPRYAELTRLLEGSGIEVTQR